MFKPQNSICHVKCTKSCVDKELSSVMLFVNGCHRLGPKRPSYLIAWRSDAVSKLSAT